MFRIIKILILVLSAYAIFTATPAQHLDMMKGVLAFKDAFIQACVREGGLCTLAIEKIQTGLFSRGSLTDTEIPSQVQNNFSSYSNTDTQTASQKP
ncbi:MAG: hypothetical protein ACKOW3_00655 [Hyphomicrobium sp.]